MSFVLGLPEGSVQSMNWDYDKLRHNLVNEVSARLSAPRLTINKLSVEVLLKQVDALSASD
jgi:hypothetical protein